MSFSSIPIVSANLSPPAMNTISCTTLFFANIRSCKILKLRESGSQYEEELTLNSGILFIDYAGVLAFNNITGKDEGEYKCVGYNGREVCSGCLFVTGK